MIFYIRIKLKERLNSKQIKEKIDEIKKVVDGYEEPYKTESFKILFSRSLESTDPPKSLVKHIHKKDEVKENDQETDRNTSNPILKLSELCKVTEEQLRDVLEYDNGHFILLKKTNGTITKEKQINASLCLVTAWAKGLDVPWVKTTDLGKQLKESSIPTKHLGENLTDTDYFVLRGKRRAAKYHITTQGWQKGIELLNEMAGK